MARNFGLKPKTKAPSDPWLWEAVTFVCTAALIVAVELLILMVVR